MCFDLALDHIHADSTESLTHPQSSLWPADRRVPATQSQKPRARAPAPHGLATWACHTVRCANLRASDPSTSFLLVWNMLRESVSGLPGGRIRTGTEFCIRRK